MRRFRWLVPPLIIGILVAVGGVYLKNREILARNAPVKPEPLANGVASKSSQFCVVQSDGDKPRFEVCADGSTQVADPPVTQLTGVRLKLYHHNAITYDAVTTDKAQFDQTGKKLFADGDFEMTLGVPAEGVPSARLLKIHGSGADFSSETGQASTTRPLRFEFEQGSGTAVGAHYDPALRELRLDSNVVLDWQGRDKTAVPMHIEAGQAWYFERESKVLLYPWAKLTRESLHMESGASEILLGKDGQIERASVPAAKGVQNPPGRNKTEFAAAHLNLDFDGNMLIRNIQAEKDATLTSTSPTTRTTVNGDRMDMAFAPSGKESLLTTAVATGSGIVRAEPVARPGIAPADTRVLRSEVIHMAMKPGGEEIDRVETDGAGTMDFLPNRADSPKRNVRGDRIWINYGIANRIQQFRTVNAFTRTEKPPTPTVASPPPMLTDSKEMIAHFDPDSSELTTLEQNTSFHYQEGDRTAKADHAVLDQKSDLITLYGSAANGPQTGLATSSDPTGSISSERILLNQHSGETTAEGRVATTRQPNHKKGQSGVFSNEETLQVTAQRMFSTNNTKHIRYEGGAVAWQGSNRVEADKIEMDQDQHVMQAHGKVMTQFVDSSSSSDKSGGKGADKGSGKAAEKKTGPAQFTVVHASDLVYTEATHLALYQGGVHLERPGLTTDSKELRAFLKDSDSETTLDKAFADGDAKIVSTTVAPATRQKRVRTGTSDHSEYYNDDQKVILMGGAPLLVDSAKGKTMGTKITWWAANDSRQDRLEVEGEINKPTQTVIRKKP